MTIAKGKKPALVSQTYCIEALLTCQIRTDGKAWLQLSNNFQLSRGEGIQWFNKYIPDEHNMAPVLQELTAWSGR